MPDHHPFCPRRTGAGPCYCPTGELNAMSPRPDPYELPMPPDHTFQKQLYDQLAGLYRAVAHLADTLTSQSGEIAELRRAVENRQAVAENCRLSAKRRWEKDKNNAS